MKNKIVFWSALREYQKEKKQIEKAIKRVFKSGQFILGRQVSLFEEEFARFCEVKYAVGVGNGTDALFLSLKALGVGRGDEVITVPNTAIPTVSAICSVGARPVFVDIEADTYLMDPNKIEEKISKKTKCILPVHLYGQSCQMDKIARIAKKYKLYLLEDCAQATGAEYDINIKYQISNIKYTNTNQKAKKARDEKTAKDTSGVTRRGSPDGGEIWKKAGSMGDIAAFSFYPTKIIGAYGDGGMIATNNKLLAEKARMLRMYGTKGDYYSHFLGYNSRLDELYASILRYKLRRIASYINKRREIAKRYQEELNETPLELPKVLKGASHVWHLYVVRHKKRDEIVRYLKRQKIIVGIHYPHPLHLMKAFRFLGCQKGDYPAAEKAAEEILSLPVYPELTALEQYRVISALKKFFAR